MKILYYLAILIHSEHLVTVAKGPFRLQAHKCEGCVCMYVKCKHNISVRCTTLCEGCNVSGVSACDGCTCVGCTGIYRVLVWYWS